MSVTVLAKLLVRFYLNQISYTATILFSDHKQTDRRISNKISSVNLCFVSHDGKYGDGRKGGVVCVLKKARYCTWNCHNNCRLQMAVQLTVRKSLNAVN